MLKAYIYAGTVTNVSCLPSSVYAGSHTTSSVVLLPPSISVPSSSASSTHSAPRYSVTPPPHVPLLIVSLNNKSQPTHRVDGSQYTSTVDLNADVLKSVSATRVLPASQQSMYRTFSVPQPTHARTQHHFSSKVQGQLLSMSQTPSQYVSLAPCPNEQSISHAESYYSQPHPIPYTSLQTTVYRSATTQQPSTCIKSKVRTHSRAQSHGQLWFNQQPATCISGRTSLPHISLSLSDQGGNGCNANHAPSKSNPNAVEQGYEMQRNSFQEAHSFPPVQRSLSVNAGFNSSYVAQSKQVASWSHSNSHPFSSTSVTTTNSLVHSSCVMSTYTASDRHFSVSPSSPADLSNVQVPLQSPIITTPTIQPSSSVTATDKNSFVPNSCTTAQIVKQQVQEAQSISYPKVATSSTECKTLYRRSHVRNHSLGNDLPHGGPLFFKGHARNRSLGSIPGPCHSQQTLSCRQPSLGNLSLASASSFLSNVSSRIRMI